MPAEASTFSIFARAAFDFARAKRNPPPPAPVRDTASDHGAMRAMIISTLGLVLPGSSAFLLSQYALTTAQNFVQSPRRSAAKPARASFFSVATMAEAMPSGSRA